VSDPLLLASLAADAERAGFDGFFLWDHIVYSAPTSEVSDPWVCLAAIAVATSSLRIGPMVTPLSRRRVHKVARETVTLDRLSSGRVVLGVGLGAHAHGELGPFGEVEDPVERARMLDAGLDQLAAYWGGEFKPRPVQSPRIPVWVAGRWPAKPPLRRAARWDGFFPIDHDEVSEFAESVAYVESQRASLGRVDEPFDVVVTVEAGVDPAPWAAAGATWVLTGFGQSPTEAEVRAAIAAGP
jgi:alkanesulfonate monooxygenase SsuD/methylene tetrahydromethanopterin reductase-like flavin-dependent oxidoreductase (luciferase family)